MNDDNTKYHVSDGSVLTPGEVTQLDAIECRLGDTTDIPETSDAAWSTSVRGKHAETEPGAISLRLDADILEWLRGKGPGYRAEISRILREWMLRER